MISWAPEAPGPFPACRSRWEDSGGVIKNSGNLQNFKMVTEQNSERKSERKQSHNPYPWVEKCKQFTLSILFCYFDRFYIIFEWFWTGGSEVQTIYELIV